MLGAICDVLKAMFILGFVATIILTILLSLTNMFGVIGACISLFLLVIFFMQGIKVLSNI